MSSINLIIAKRGRNDHYRTCLTYLDLANQRRRHNIVIYTVDDGVEPLSDKIELANVKLEYIVHPRARELAGPFRKSILLNYAINNFRQDYDWFSIVDADMVYHHSYYDQVGSRIGNDVYLVSHGYKLAAPATATVIDGVKRGVPMLMSQFERLPMTEFLVGPSQISMAKSVYHLFAWVYGTANLYNEEFIGWGGEDSQLSFKSSEMVTIGLIKKTSIPKLWYHLHHEHTVDQQQYNKNFELLSQLRSRDKELLVAYVERKAKENSQ